MISVLIVKNKKKISLRDEQDKIDWFLRKSEHSGFRTHDFIFIDEPKVYSKKNNIQFNSVVYQGILEVVDEDLFNKTLKKGIGKGKAYGFGMLSLKSYRF